jgi:hypothetical protein
MKMKVILFLLTGCLFISGMHVFADDITMSSEQSDYYYLVGTDAQVPFTIDSSFTNTLIGTLQYSLTRKQDDGGFSISQTNTQSQSFPIAPGRSDHALTLTSESETNYDLSLLLIYEDKGKDFAVVLPPISVHFVSEQKDVKQVKETLRSTTSEATKTPSSLSGQDPFSQMEQEMEQMRQEQQQLMQNLLSQSGSGYSTRQSSPQNSQQALQNNQMSFSSSALKQQMMQESQQTEENKRKLADSLEKDPIVQKQASDLRNAGYNQTSGKIVPTGPDRGEVSVQFENEDGEKIAVTGKAENSKISSLTAEKSGEIPVPPELASNSTWNERKEQARNNSMVPSSGSVARTPNETMVTQEYVHPDGRNATLTAWIVNNTVQKIELKQDEAFPLFWFIGIFLVIILVVLCAGVAWWYYSTRPEEVQSAPQEMVPERDYSEVVQEMINKAEKTYAGGDKKEGYIILGQAVRMFISHTHGHGEAITNDEIISGVVRYIPPIQQSILDLLNSCSQVEYAKGQPDDENFVRFLQEVRQMAGLS